MRYKWFFFFFARASKNIHLTILNEGKQNNPPSNFTVSGMFRGSRKIQKCTFYTIDWPGQRTSVRTVRRTIIFASERIMYRTHYKKKWRKFEGGQNPLKIHSKKQRNRTNPSPLKTYSNIINTYSCIGCLK